VLHKFKARLSPVEGGPTPPTTIYRLGPRRSGALWRLVTGLLE